MEGEAKSRRGDEWLNLVKELRHNRDLFDHFHPHTEAVVPEQLAKSLTIDQVDCRRAIPRCFTPRVGGERARRDDQTLVGSALHGAAEIAYGGGADGALIALA